MIGSARHRSRSIVAALLAGLASASLAGADEASRRLEAVVDATALHDVQLFAGQGDVEVRVGDGEQVQVTVELFPGRKGIDGFADRLRSWFLTSKYRDNAALVEGARLIQDVRGDRLTLDLEPARSARRDRLHERWTLVIPARLAVALELEVGDAVVSGPIGGVEARVSVGTLRVDSPAGDVDARIEVGDVTIQTKATEVGDVTVDADVGDADLWVDGSRIDHDDAPGPGGRVALRGHGGVRIRATASVGDATVRIR